MSTSPLDAAPLPSINVYHQALRALPRRRDMNDEQERDLVARARGADREAKEAIIASLLWTVAFYARRYYNLYSWLSPRIEYEELIAAGNLALLEYFERALEHDNPISYLLAVARKTIHRCCYIYGNLLSIPKDTLTPFEAIERLDLPLAENSDLTLAETLELLDSGMDFSHPSEGQERDYTALSAAVEQLAPQQREVITRLYGLQGRPCEELPTIQKELLGTEGCETIYGYKTRALMRLYRHLADAYPQWAAQGGMHLLQSQTPHTEQNLRQPETRDCPLPLTQEHRERLTQAQARLQIRGEKVTALALAREAHLNNRRACTYLSEQRKQDAATPDTRLERLKGSYGQLQESGKQVTAALLATTAGVSREIASTYLFIQSRQNGQATYV